MIGLHKNISTGYFDGVRGLAVLIVWLSHSSGRGQPLSDWLVFHGIGHVGVMLFFVLSGYLLSISIMFSEKTFNFKSYLVNRFLRIAPMYYLTVFSVFLYQEVTGNISEKYLYIHGGYVGFIKHLLFIKGDGLFWTISAEFIFYLILPVLVFYLLKKKYVAVKVLLISSLIYSFYHLLIYIHFIDLPGLKVSDIHHYSQYLDVFVIGVIYGFLSKDLKAIEYYSIHKKLLDFSVIVIFILTITITLVLVSKSFLIFNQPLYSFRFISIGYALSFGFILFSLQMGNVKLRVFFSSRILMFVGIVGYSWYLIHFPIIAITNTLDIAPALKFIISTVLVSILSLASYLVIEEPFIKLGKRLKC